MTSGSYVGGHAPPVEEKTSGRAWTASERLMRQPDTERLLGRLEAKVDAVHEDVREIKDNTRALEGRTRTLERTMSRCKGAVATMTAAMAVGLTWLGLD